MPRTFCKEMRLTKNDAQDLGFVVWCLFSEAINKEEFRQWVLHVIEVVDAPPSYIFDLIDFDGPLADLHKIIPFTGGWNPNETQLKAVTGIALKRGVTPFEPVSRERCLLALADNPEVEDWFEKMFPFINRDAEQGGGGQAATRSEST